MRDWVPELEFVPPTYFRQISSAIHYITGHLEGLIFLEGPPDDGDDPEFAENASIKVKHQKSPSKAPDRDDEEIVYIQNETRVSQPTTSRCYLPNLDYSATNAEPTKNVPGERTRRSKVGVVGVLDTRRGAPYWETSVSNR